MRMRTVSILALLAAVGLVGATAAAASVLGHPFGFFSREPSEVLGAPAYTGFLSYVMLLVWFSSAVVCLFGGALVAALRGRTLAAAPLLAAGILSLVLSVDDALRMHEDFLPVLFGIPKEVTYSVYALAVSAWLVAHRRFILGTDWQLLGVALGFLGLSVMLDRAFVEHQRHVFEDGAKLVGIVAWTLYFARTTYVAVLAAASDARRAARPSATADAHRLRPARTRRAVGA